MTKVLPFLGSTELEVLSVLGAFLLVLTHLATAYCVKEKVLVSSKYVAASGSGFVVIDSQRRNSDKGLRKEFKEIWDNIRTLPPTIRQIVCDTTTYCL